MIENTNTKQFYPGPILNNTLEITDFLFNDAEQIKIKHSKLNEEDILVDVDLNYPTDYEVTKVLPSDINAAEAALTASTGQITLKNVNVLAGEKLTVYRVSQIIQDKDYPRTGAFPAATHEGALDYLTMQNQEQKDEIDRALKVPISTQNFEGSLPLPIPSRALKINNDGTGFEMSEFDPDLALVITEEFKNQARQAALDALSSQTAAANSEIVATQQSQNATTQAVNAKASADNAAELNQQLTNNFNAYSSSLQGDFSTYTNNLISIKEDGMTSLANASNALRTTQISNCTLKKSEKINLVFSNGVLTLKAGSEVIVPNGFENNGTNKIFNKVIVSSDISLSSPSTTQGTRFVCVTTSNMQLAHFLVDYVYSGNSEKMNTITPKQYILFYNTDTNRIYRGSSNTDGEWYAVSNISIPICKIENDSTATITALKEVYNSVAIMGSTIFADKDIEGLSPNGRNVDGTLNSTQIKTNKVLSATITSGTSEKPHGLVVTNNVITHRVYFEQEQAPEVVSRWYNPQTNYMYTNSSSAIDTWIQDQSVLIGYVTIKDGVYTSLKINNSFRAADYYEVNAKLDEVSNRVENKVDKVQAISALMPDWNTAVSKTFTGGELYEVPYDCVLVMSVTSSSSKHLFLRLNGSDGIPIYSAYVDSAGLSRTIVDMIYLEKGTILWADVAQSGITQDNYIVALKGVA